MDMKKTIAALAALVMFAACGADKPADNGSAVQTISLESKTEAAAVSDRFTDNVKPLGRTYTDDNGMWMFFSGTGAAFSFEGKSCRITIKGDSTALTGSDENRARVGVFVDGERVADVMIDEREKVITAVEEDTSAVHEVRVVKLSESANSVCGIGDIECDGDILPASEKELKIEFIGDSITCGYGVDDLDRSHHFATSTEDCTKAYAIKTAELLDADYSLVSMSGWGIISGYSDGKTQQKNQVIPKIYDLAGYSYGNFSDGMQPQSIEWDSTAFEPDVVVINLGTNDNSWTKQEEERLFDFTDSYVEFVKHIREEHPDAYIVCSLGIMGADLYPFIEYAINDQYIPESGDEKIACLRFDTQVEADGIAADWHPSEATHTKAAQKLADFIKEKIG